MASRARVLQIFNRYLKYGGEEGSMYRIGDAMRKFCDVENFISSTAEVVEGHGLGTLALKSAYNREIDRKLGLYQKAGRFDAWQIHNIFPIMSPIVYQRAFEWGVPIIQYLHNYRLSCVNGFFLNHGHPCQRCFSGSFWPAFFTACWRESHLKSGWMGLITNRIRRMPLFEKVFRWITLSEAQKREYVRMGIPIERITVIHHFLEPTAPPLPPTHAPHALFVGRLSVEKGVSQLLTAWKLIAGGERKLFIVGDGPERENLHRQAAGIPGVEFFGFVKHEQQREIWRRSLFSLMPSIWLEPFGMTVLEAWSHGRPIVAHEIGGLPELIQHGVNGLLANPNRSEELADRMERLLSAPVEAAKMGLAGRERLEDRFNKSRWLNQIAEVYAKIP